MLDFSRVSFNKAMMLSVTKPITFETKYELKYIADVFPVIESGARPEGGVDNIKDGILSLGGEHIDNDSGYLRLDSPKYIPVGFYDSKEKGKVQKDDILICKDGARTGKVAFVRDEFVDRPAMLNEHVFLLRSGDPTTQYYVFQLLYSPTGQALLKSYMTGSAQGGLNSTNLKQIKIPLPPLDIQEQIVAECEAVDDEYNATRMSIESYRKKIKEPCSGLESKFSLRVLEDLLVPVIGSMTKVPQDAIKDIGDIPVISQEKETLISGYVSDEEAITDLPLIVFGDHTCVFKYVDFEFVRGADGTQLLKTNASVIEPKYLYYYLQTVTITNRDKYERHMKYLKVIKIPVPPLNVQQKIIDECEAIEKKIAAAEEKLESLKGKTAEILNRYLN